MAIGTPFNFTRGIPTSSRIGTPFGFTRGIPTSSRIGTPFGFTRGIPTSSRIGTPYTYKQLLRIKTGAFVRTKDLNIDVPLPAFVSVVAALPDPEVYVGHIIHVVDEVGGPVIAFSDGTDWLRVTDRAVVS
jgi:hypothetical protein